MKIVKFANNEDLDEMALGLVCLSFFSEFSVFYCLDEIFLRFCRHEYSGFFLHIKGE